MVFANPQMVVFLIPPNEYETFTVNFWFSACLVYSISCTVMFHNKVLDVLLLRMVTTWILSRDCMKLRTPHSCLTGNFQLASSLNRDNQRHESLRGSGYP